jgi:hypothetical protein
MDLLGSLERINLMANAMPPEGYPNSPPSTISKRPPSTESIEAGVGK